jgi:hypothetical protein
MKALLTTIAALCCAGLLQAQGTQYAPEQLDQLVGPVALYPDPLVALILPASTDPNDLAAAAQYLGSNGDPSQVDTQSWDASVKGLAHYPTVLEWMANNMDWTQALGAAFAMQPADVMKSVQQMRAKAIAAGTLVNTPQMQIDYEGNDIRLVPADPNTVYVPEYNADDVYDVPEGYDGPFITFGAGYPVGPWLGYECDWDDFGIWIGPWRPGWDYRRDWVGGGFGGSRWHPDARRGHALVRNYYRPGAFVAHPAGIAGARGPAPSPGGFRGGVPGTRPPVNFTRSVPDYRGYAAPGARTAPAAPSGPLFGGYSRGTQARANSARGHASRQAPVRSAPARRSSGAPGRERH